MGKIKKDLKCTPGIVQDHSFKLFYLVTHVQLNFHQFNVLKLCLKKIDIRK